MKHAEEKVTEILKEITKLTNAAKIVVVIEQSPNDKGMSPLTVISSKGNIKDFEENKITSLKAPEFFGILESAKMFLWDEMVRKAQVAQETPPKQQASADYSSFSDYVEVTLNHKDFEIWPHMSSTMSPGQKLVIKEGLALSRRDHFAKFNVDLSYRKLEGRELESFIETKDSLLMSAVPMNPVGEA